MFDRIKRGDDSGFSLMEVMVGSAIMSTVMAIATSGFISMYQTTNRTEAAALTQTSLSSSFERMDREVRYAYRINDGYATTFGGVDGYAIDYVIPDANNSMLCVQLTLPKAGGTLVRRQWPQTSTPADATATSTAIAQNVISDVQSTVGPADLLNPFVRKAAGDAMSNYDRMWLRVGSTVGVGDKGRKRTYDLTFTALNTVEPATPLTCNKG